MGKMFISLPAWNGYKASELTWTPWEIWGTIKHLLLCLFNQCTCRQMGPCWLTCQKHSVLSNKTQLRVQIKPQWKEVVQRLPKFAVDHKELLQYIPFHLWKFFYHLILSQLKLPSRKLTLSTSIKRAFARVSDLFGSPPNCLMFWKT